MFDTYEAAAKVSYLLLEDGYVVMLSREEGFWCVNWIWTTTPADCNEVVFRNLEELEDEIDKYYEV